MQPPASGPGEPPRPRTPFELPDLLAEPAPPFAPEAWDLGPTSPVPPFEPLSGVDHASDPAPPESLPPLPPEPAIEHLPPERAIEHLLPEPLLEPPTIGDPGRQREIVSTLLSDPPGRPDTKLDFGSAGALEVRAASIRGRSHRYAPTALLSKPRQDDYWLRLTADGAWLVAFVADGVSSGSDSHIAASLAVRRGADMVVDALDGGAHPAQLDWGTGIANRLGALINSEGRRRIAARGRDPETIEGAEVIGAMSTTAIAGVIATQHDADGLVPYYAASIAGDSSIWELRPTGWHPRTSVKNAGAEIASNAVAGLPLVGEPTVLEGRLRPGDALFLMSDGLGDPLDDGTGEVGKYLAARWQAPPPDAYLFTSMLDFYRRAAADDRTAIGIWAQPAEPA